MRLRRYYRKLLSIKISDLTYDIFEIHKVIDRLAIDRRGQGEEPWTLVV